MEVIISDAECNPSAIIAVELPKIPAITFITVNPILSKIDIIVTLLDSSYLFNLIPSNYHLIILLYDYEAYMYLF